MSEQQGFWTSLQGILTGIAAVITAITGLYIAVFNNGDSNAVETVDTSGTTISTPVVKPNEGSLDQGLKSPVLIAAQEGKKSETVKSSETLPKPVNKNLPAFPETGPLVDCKQFPSVNSITSLMSWSNHYHKKIVEGHESNPEYSCNHAVGNRARAHCMELDNMEIRQALLESLTLCRRTGFEWTQVTPK